MNKYSGKIGFVEEREVKPGIIEPVITEKTYFGDISKNTSKWKQNTQSTNDGFDISNKISIVADPYANSNLSKIVYATFMNETWKVTDIEVASPRLILTLGGKYVKPTTN